jgi:signal peptidase I
MQSPSAGTGPSGYSEPPPLSVLVLSSVLVAPFPDHVGLDRDDPWLPPASPQSFGNMWPWDWAQISEMLEVVTLAILMFMAVRAMGQNFIVDGSSMTPTFANNELLIVNRLAYIEIDFAWLPGVDNEYWRPFGEPRQGDVVVFAFPGDETRDFIKRVTAVPGQTVEIRDGTVFVDEIPVDEPYLGEDWGGNTPAQVVPEGNLFVMGDNRNNSFDSRSWGMLDQRLLVGRAELKYWPFDQVGMVNHHHPEPEVALELSATH